ncbi:MAG TPA: S8 family serine peptidase [Balneolaceae bacterium]|nr:S8 family serine peptidase [Balneolaceae bacterium]
MRNALGKLMLVISLAIMGLYACDQPTTNINANKSNKEIAPEPGQVINGQYIVVFKDQDFKAKAGAENVDKVKALRNKVLTDYNIAGSSVLGRYNVALKGFAAQLDNATVASLRKDSRIAYLEKDRILTLSPPCGTPTNPCDGGGGGTTGQTTPWGVTRVGGPTASNGTAWIIDTGIDLNHPDLNVDVSRSATFVSKGKDSKSADDGNGHGTHVAGTIAAINNNIDVVGVAAGATVVAVKVLDHRGSGSYSDVISGIDYVAANASPGDVANMSLGGPTSQALDDAVRNAADAGVMFAIAAGNDSDDANNYSPARVEHKNVWTVSAIDDNDAFASFSNYSGPSAPPVEFAAPGVSVLSLWKDGGTNTISGTSMATPHLAGLLLVTGGNPTTDGHASSDPDGDPDPIAHN